MRSLILLIAFLLPLTAPVQAKTHRTHHSPVHHSPVHHSPVRHSSAWHTRHTTRPVKTSTVKAPVDQGVKVWVNTNTGVYHFPGQRWYGNTAQGEYVSESAAKKAGYRATENGQ